MAKTIAQLKRELAQEEAALARHMIKWNKASDDYQAGAITWDEYNEVDNKRCDFEYQISLLKEIIND